MSFPLKNYWELLARHIRPQLRRFIALAILLLASIGLQLVNPQIMRFFIDTALNGGLMQQLLLAAGAFLGIALLQQAISVILAYLGENVAWKATNALRAELALHCLNLDMSFHNEHTPGELIERIDGDVTELATFFSTLVVTLIGNGLLMVGILAALFYADWRAGAAFSIFCAAAIFSLYRVRDIALKDHEARRQAEADLFGFIEEQLTGTEDIRASGAVDFSLRELFRLQSGILHHDRKAHKKGMAIDILMGGLMVFGNILAIASGYFLFHAGVITIGTVYLFIYYMNMLETPIWTLTREVGNFQVIGACVKRLTELRKIKPKVVDNVATDSDAALTDGALEVAFERVSFCYQPGESVLDELSFKLKPGGILGLLGRTGSGKTTLTRLIFRLYEPTRGQVLLGGKDIRSSSLRALRQRIGIVTQEVQLFHASVRDNLTLFDKSILDTNITSVLEELELGDWLRALPDGLNTQIESGGHSLSAGEAQLLAFARIFLHNPGLVILDEASSRLDPATEQRIERAIDRLLKGRTAIVVAHRLATVQRADDILILEGGRVREYGCRKRLAANPDSRFYQLLQTGLEEVLA